MDRHRFFVLECSRYMFKYILDGTIAIQLQQTDDYVHKYNSQIKRLKSR